MLTNVASKADLSNSGGAILGIKCTQSGTIQSAINAALRKKFAKKTWTYVSFLIGEKERATKHRLAGTREYNLLNIVKLLRSDIGFQILKALMGDEKKWPAWFKICVIQIREAKIQTDFSQMQLSLDLLRKERVNEVAKLAEEA
jgi:hypothetical protein